MRGATRRSDGAAGRPLGRPAATPSARLAALLVPFLLLAVAPAGARAAELEFEATHEPPPAAVETLAPGPVEAEPVEAAPVELPEPAPVAVPEAAPVEPPEPAPVAPAPAEPEPPPPPTAVNRARTVQLIVQVQVGCRHHCDRTTQSQTAIQEARTEQTAVAPGGDARNEAVTEQYVWQLQIGCFLFCTGTVQTQTVEQRATTVQHTSGTIATSSSTTVQAVRQVQASHRPRTLFAELDAFVRELSLDVTVTLQVLRQVQVAGCRHHCTGDSQIQLAEQHALTTQQAAVTAVSRDPPGD